MLRESRRGGYDLQGNNDSCLTVVRQFLSPPESTLWWRHWSDTVFFLHHDGCLSSCMEDLLLRTSAFRLSIKARQTSPVCRPISLISRCFRADNRLSEHLQRTYIFIPSQTTSPSTTMKLPSSSIIILVFAVLGAAAPVLSKNCNGHDNEHLTNEAYNRSLKPRSWT